MRPVLKKKRYIAAAAIMTLVILVALSPFILSTSSGLNFFLLRVNSWLPGTLHAESWIVGWQQGILCQQVEYVDPARGIRISIPRLTTTQGFLELVLAPKNLGTVIVESPVIEINLSDASKSEQAPSLDTKGDEDEIPIWNQLNILLEIREGSLLFRSAQPEREVGLAGIKLDADLQGGVVKYDFAFHTLPEQGTLRAGGSLNLPARRHGWLDTLIARTDLVVTGVNIQDFLAIAGEHALLPTGSGLLSADLHLKTVGLHEVQVSGSADCRDLKLAGGPLGEDSPSFRALHLGVDEGRWSRNDWMASRLEFDGDTATFKGSVESGAEGISLKGEGNVNLPVLFDQFPHLLHLKEAAFVENGRLNFVVDFVRRENAGKIKLTAGLDGLGGLYEGRRFSWATPSSLILNAEIGDRNIKVPALRLEAPFAHIDGRGDLQSFILDGDADFQQMFTDIGRLIDTGWDGSGKMELAVKGRTPSLDDTSLVIDADLGISDFTLNRKERMVVPRHHLSLVAGVTALKDLPWKQRGPLNLEIAMSSWLGEMFLVLDGEKTAERSFTGYYTTDSSFNLDSVTGLLHTTRGMPEEISMAGDLQVQAAGYLDGETLELREFTGGIGGFVLVRDKDVFEDQDIRMQMGQAYDDTIPSLILRDIMVAPSREHFFRYGAGLNRINFQARNCYLHDLNLSFKQTGSFHLDSLRVEDWLNPLAELGGKLEGDFDLGKLSGLLRAAGMLPVELGMDGKGTGSLAVETATAGGRDAQAQVQLRDVSISWDRDQVLSEDRVAVQAALADTGSGESEIRDLSIDSTALGLRARGRIAPAGARQQISLQGEITPDLEKIGIILSKVFDIEIAMAGKTSEPFSFVYNGAAGTKVPIMDILLETELRAKSLDFRGMRVDKPFLPLSLQQGILHLDFSGSLEGGAAGIVADVDLTRKPPVLTVPQSRDVLDSVPLQKPLVNLLLSKVYPLFGVLAQPSGRVGVRLDSLSWPLQVGENKDASFVAVFDVRDAKFKSKEVLRKVFDRFGLDGRELAPGDNELYCLARVGTITCSPLNYAVKGTEITVSGFLGMDGALDYKLDVPVTRKLMGRDIPAELEGRKITVPVSGTKADPRVDTEAIDDAIDALVRQAAD